MKIYVVTTGEHDDYQIEAVFTEEGLANDYAARYFDKYRQKADIETYEANPTELGDKDLVGYRVEMIVDGTARVDRWRLDNIGITWKIGIRGDSSTPALINFVTAENGTQAIDTTNELRARIIERGLWRVGMSKDWFENSANIPLPPEWKG